MFVRSAPCGTTSQARRVAASAARTVMSTHYTPRPCNLIRRRQSTSDAVKTCYGVNLQLLDTPTPAHEQHGRWRGQATSAAAGRSNDARVIRDFARLSGRKWKSDVHTKGRVAQRHAAR